MQIPNSMVWLGAIYIEMLAQVCSCYIDLANVQHIGISLQQAQFLLNDVLPFPRGLRLGC